jgi:hypothetical protein
MREWVRGKGAREAVDKAAQTLLDDFSGTLIP